jgi:hypothetical protein
MILFTGGTVIMLILGRSGFGVDQALSSRYVSMTVMGIIGLYCAFICMKPGVIEIKPLMTRAVIALLVLFIFCTDIYVMGMIKGRYDDLKSAQLYLVTYQMQPDANLKPPG